MLKTASVPRQVALDCTPMEVATRLRDLPGLIFFDSALETSGHNQISIIAADPCEILRGQDWTALGAAVAARQCTGGHDDGLPHGFAAGWVDYEGSFCFGFYEQLLIYRHANQTWHEIGHLSARLNPQLNPPFGATAPQLPAPARSTAPQFEAQLSAEKFCAMVARAKEYISAGDIYQVNLSHRFEAAWQGDPFAFYEALRHYSPAPYGALLALGGRTLLSSSPECFLKMSGRSILTRPIKGTRPRRQEPMADEKSAYDLMTSAKEIAELIMITDLERSDIGAVCEFGSVSVKELLKLERFEQVFHLVSTIEGRLRQEIDHVTALHACFPGGSITGAPKKRAREIIGELESGPRGNYTGAIGWFGFNGESHFNIAIRTAVLEEGRAHFQVGAGIVADSVPEKEWQETLDKAAGILLAAASLDV